MVLKELIIGLELKEYYDRKWGLPYPLISSGMIEDIANELSRMFGTQFYPICSALIDDYEIMLEASEDIKDSFRLIKLNDGKVTNTKILQSSLVETNLFDLMLDTAKEFVIEGEKLNETCRN